MAATATILGFGCVPGGGGGGGDGGIATIIECDNGDYARNGEECPSRRDVLRHHGLVEGSTTLEEDSVFSCARGEFRFFDDGRVFGHACVIENDFRDPVRDTLVDTIMSVAVSRKTKPEQVIEYAIGNPGLAYVVCSGEDNTPSLYVTDGRQNFVEDSCQEDL